MDRNALCTLLKTQPVMMPEPVCAQPRWKNLFKAVEGRLMIKSDETGSIASLGFLSVLVEMVTRQRDVGMLRPHAGEIGYEPIDVTMMFDGFPVDEISMTHWCLANCSLAEHLADQSEALLSVVCIARKTESNQGFHDTLKWNGVGEEFNSLVEKGFIQTSAGECLNMFASPHPPTPHTQIIPMTFI